MEIAAIYRPRISLLADDTRDEGLRQRAQRALNDLFEAAQAQLNGQSDDDFPISRSNGRGISDFHLASPKLIFVPSKVAEEEYYRSTRLALEGVHELDLPTGSFFLWEAAARLKEVHNDARVLPLLLFHLLAEHEHGLLVLHFRPAAWERFVPTVPRPAYDAVQQFVLEDLDHGALALTAARYFHDQLSGADNRIPAHNLQRHVEDAFILARFYFRRAKLRSLGRNRQPTAYEPVSRRDGSF
ncbi:hypothetical protein JCM10207_008216 [Rhodosporidiobolus poonsookiae]